MDEQRCVQFQAIHVSCLRKFRSRSLSISVEMWMEMNGHFWRITWTWRRRERNGAAAMFHSKNCLYCLRFGFLFCSSSSFALIYSANFTMDTLWFHVPSLFVLQTKFYLWYIILRNINSECRVHKIGQQCNLFKFELLLSFEYT